MAPVMAAAILCRRDLVRRFASQMIRMLAYGLLAVIWRLCLAEQTFDAKQIGLPIARTLLGDTTNSLGAAAITCAAFALHHIFGVV